MRPLLVGVEAQADITEAIEWLNRRSAELPPRFRSALEDAFASIIETPALYPAVHHKVRRALLHHFPYSVFYIILPEAVLILGVIHQARHPSLWKRRSPN